MTFKRYGFKGPSGNEGGAHDSYTIMRFIAVVFSFVILMFSWATSNVLFLDIYIPAGFIYLLATLPPEIYPKIKNWLVLLVSAIGIGISIYYNEEIFTRDVKVYEPATGRHVREYQYLLWQVIISILYHISVAVFSFVFLPKQKYV